MNNRFGGDELIGGGICSDSAYGVSLPENLEKCNC
jgi:hypothetical protein